MKYSYIIPFQTIQKADQVSVGAKNFVLGKMRQALADQGVIVPDGFALITRAYHEHIQENGLSENFDLLVHALQETNALKNIARCSDEIRELLCSAPLPKKIRTEIEVAYHALGEGAVAVRSSATLEDGLSASFAGQQESFLGVQGIDSVCEAVVKCMASMFTARAISYRNNVGVGHHDVAMSVCIQTMVKADQESSGVAFSLDPETGNQDFTMINSSYGLGQSIVSGLVSPDEFVVHRRALQKGFYPIVKKTCTDKSQKIICKDGASVSVAVGPKARYKFSITDEQVIAVANAVEIVESFYESLAGKRVPVDVEWAFGPKNQLFILQARPETVHARDTRPVYKRYKLNMEGAKIAPIVSGQAIGTHIVHGRIRKIASPDEARDLNKNDIIVTKSTDPDWMPLLRTAAAVITQHGGRTCHAAIVSRELGISALIGVHDALSALKDGQDVTIDCSKGALGNVYEGHIPFSCDSYRLDLNTKPNKRIRLNIADPDRARALARLPVAGVGLARVEFIVSNYVGMHPMAAVDPDKLDKETREQVEQLTRAYKDPKTYVVDRLSQGIGTIAAAFYPREVIVRLSDFKTNEYHGLLGGSFFEHHEENPMMGLRGASRYISDSYRLAFELECKAIKQVRNDMGLTNVIVMVPFVRTLNEARQVVEVMRENGLERGKDGLILYMMCEIPSNVLLIREFAKFFDGFSIGSNDLTQFTLAVDRDEARLAKLFDERDPAVIAMLRMAIAGAHAVNKPIGICGQAPSDFPELFKLLMDESIDTFSLNPDAALERTISSHG
ncbi:phosphoenolpyruvate synthase [bacterium]|jgi:pyruvate, water dikinase|nr:phosphoenolpyruvate synthase [bacterium]MBT3903245.1 phosphoenolpyruvate synthase [bacterium]MBT4578139.1 phosphoenolpyruvate synthase [bacterium]MBT5345569.1 phosphoenolpyruvate synthase [bacterium]MBT6131072.1 phosphoenolpyruvate synthase [bacterium]